MRRCLNASCKELVNSRTWCLRGWNRSRNHLCLVTVHSECRLTRPTLYSLKSCHSTVKIWIGLETHLLQFFIQKETHIQLPSPNQTWKKPTKGVPRDQETDCVCAVLCLWLSSEHLAPLISKTVLLLTQQDQNFTIYLSGTSMWPIVL